MQREILTCILCVDNSRQLLPLEELSTPTATAQEVLKLHFPFYDRFFENRSLRRSVICPGCWTQLETFHRFYLDVAQNYQIADEYEVEVIKEEDDTYNNPVHEIEMDEHESKELIYYEEVTVEALDEALEESSDVSVTPKNEPKPLNLPTAGSQRRSFPTPIDPADDERIRDTAEMYCELCAHPFDGLAQARTHFRQEHDTIGYIVCCGRRFKQRNRLLDHVNTHYNMKHPCEVCGKSFDSKAYLMRHLVYHNEEKIYQCDHCPKSFPKKFLVRNHLLSVHIYDNVVPSFECPLPGCDKVFVNETRLKHHVKYTHSSENQEICSICSKTFKTRSAIDEHMKVHFKRPENRFKCEICGHYIGDIKTFKRHVKNHETEGMENICHYCQKVSPNLNALKKHIRYVHETEKKFNCRYCEKKFKRSRNLIDHEATHTMQDLYKCSFCPKTFRNQSNMLSHRKKQHPDKYQKPAYMREDIV